MNAPSNVPATQRRPSEIEVLKANVSRRADDFRMVLPSHIGVDKFQRTIATAALSNPTLLQCDRQSLLIAAMKLAQDGLLPDGREAALVPFKTWNRETRQTTWQVQAMPMAWGLRKKILQSGMVVSLETGLVYRAELESGHFIYEIGMDPPIRHRPKLDLTDEQTSDHEIVAAYSIARIKPDGEGVPYWSVEVMRRSEIDKVRQASQTGAVGKTTRDGKAIPPKGPWVDWYGEMARKTVLRRHSKVLPMSGDIMETFDRDRDEEVTVDSAAAMLSVQPDAPLVLPQHDEETGELIEDNSATSAGVQIEQESEPEPARDVATGMTQVDEETARALDAGQSEDPGYDPSQDSAAEETSDVPLDPYRGKLWAEKRRVFLDDLVKVEKPAQIKRIEDEITKIFIQFPDEVQDELEAALGAARKRLRNAASSAQAGE